MSDPATFRLAAAAVLFVPALLWAVFAQSIWGFIRKRRPRSRVFLVLLALSCLFALHYVLWTLLVLAPSHSTRVLLLAASDLGAAALLAVGRHFARVWPVRADSPRPSWLGVNYGGAVVAASVFVLADLGAGGVPEAAAFLPFAAYLLAMGALTVWDVRRFARCGVWQPGRLDEYISADAIALGLGFAALVTSLAVDRLAGATGRLVAGGGSASPAVAAFVLLHAAGGLVIAVPFAVRDLADTLRGFVDRKSTRLNSSHITISYAVFCLKKKNYIKCNQDNPTHRPHPLDPPGDRLHRHSHLARQIQQRDQTTPGRTEPRRSHIQAPPLRH